MKEMVFVGVHKELYEGMGALVRGLEENPEKVLAQFNSHYLLYGDRNPYAYNWWEFNKSDFLSVEEYQERNYE